MSDRYPGGFITKTPVVPTPSSASGVWTLDQQLQAQKSGTWPFGGPFNYIEDVFSTWLYTGTGATQTITNGIDLSGKGGLVWYKSRSNATDHELVDTVRGGTKYIQSNSASGQGTLTSTEQLSFSSTGFSIGGSNFNGNQSGRTYASWTFRKQPKFFDVVTYTGTGSARTIAHNLGSAPGCIFVKSTSSSSYPDWLVYHRSLGSATALSLNSSGTGGVGATFWNNTAPTSTVFSLGDSYYCNEPGTTYVAYLFAHNAGGFGLTGTDNVISCGSFTTDGSGNASVTLGYEPQFTLQKASSGTGNWFIADNMRGMPVGAVAMLLRPNLADAESAGGTISPAATGFSVSGYPTSTTFIYIAIRRGPMKTPTSGTSVFTPTAYTGNSTSGRVITTGNLPDLTITKARDSASYWPVWFDRLRGGEQIQSNNTDAGLAQGSNVGGYVSAYNNLSYAVTSGSSGLASVNGAQTYVDYALSRAPGFFDEVCGTGAITANHNLGVVPELLIYKRRDGADPWYVACSGLGSINADYILLNTTAAKVTEPNNLVNATSTTFNTSYFAGAGNTWVAYLFATVAGVSKVGSYTGTGTTKQIDCGFTGGARFVLIKRTDSTGDWYVWDSARGIVAGNDPYLLLNSTAAEVTTTDYVDTYSAGFEISSTAPAAINANGGTFIFLAIA